MCTFHDKKNYLCQIGLLKTALKHDLILKKVHAVINLIRKDG